MLVVFAVLFIGCVIFAQLCFIRQYERAGAGDLDVRMGLRHAVLPASGDFDLSVASVIACAGVTTAVVIISAKACGWGSPQACCWGASGSVNGFFLRALR